jgi:hypothetical protein
MLQVVVSYYDRRPLEPLVHLLDSLEVHPAGAAYELTVVVNSTGLGPLPEAIAKRANAVAYRPNHGMNIGAWSHGLHQTGTGSATLFLQDECYAIVPGWASAVLASLARGGVGMVGESMNSNWTMPWEALRASVGRTSMPEHTIAGMPANRVDVYLDFMRRNGIDPGADGAHLRSLVWGFNRSVLDALGGFPCGTNYGECIGAEIGVSRAVIAMGQRLALIGSEPFSVFRHIEWNQDFAGGPFTHRPVLLEELRRLKSENAELRARLGTAGS